MIDRGGNVVQTIEYRGPEALYAGVAWSPDDRHAYASAGGDNKIRVYGVAGGTLTEGSPVVIPTSTVKNPFPAGLAVAPDAAHLFVADQMGDSFSAVALGSRTVTTVPAGHNPYGVALSADGRLVLSGSRDGSRRWQGRRPKSALRWRSGSPLRVRRQHPKSPRPTSC